MTKEPKAGSRVIKFRVWDKENMRYCEDGAVDGADFYVCPNGTVVAIGDDDGGKNGLHEHFLTLSDDRLIVEQFTGLHDKNGKEIYEGDILRHDLWGDSQIIWEEGGFRGIGGDHDIALAHHQLKRSRVVGNVHESPELLK